MQRKAETEPYLLQTSKKIKLSYWKSIAPNGTLYTGRSHTRM